MLLNEAFRGSRTVCLDLPGSGRRRDVDCPLSGEGIVDALRAYAASELGPLEQIRPRVLALSFGSMIAYQWLCRYPKELSRLVLVSPSFRKVSPWHQRLKWNVLPAIARAFLEPSLESSEKRILSIVSNFPHRQRQALKSWVEIRKTRGIRRENVLRQLMAASQAGVPASPPDGVPMLILGSHADRLVDARCFWGAAEKLKSPVRLHGTAGHDLPLDDPQWVIAQVKEWMSVSALS